MLQLIINNYVLKNSTSKLEHNLFLDSNKKARRWGNRQRRRLRIESTHSTTSGPRSFGCRRLPDYSPTTTTTTRRGVDVWWNRESRRRRRRDTGRLELRRREENNGGGNDDLEDGGEHTSETSNGECGRTDGGHRRRRRRLDGPDFFILF